MAKIIIDYCNNVDPYNGEVEKQLFDIIKSHNEEEKDNLLKTSNNYSFLYHLKMERGHIIGIADIKKEDQCLEIGSECGAISEAILRKSDHLDCIDISNKRSEINLERNRDKKGLNIYVGRLQDVAPKLKKKYDKIFIIGILEYASSHINAENPYLEMLKTAKKLLNKDGKIYIAIDNKYGLRYFAGAKDDRTGKAFESIEGYGENIRTFSAKTIQNLLKEAGFADFFFYFPFPDFRFPNVIYSERMLPNEESFRDLGHSLNEDRAVLFNEDNAFREASKEGLIEMFTNSFLIEVNG